MLTVEANLLLLERLWLMTGNASLLADKAFILELGGMTRPEHFLFLKRFDNKTFHLY